MFCSHVYGQVIDGIQYCHKCNVARRLPPAVCAHQWVEKTTYEAGANIKRDGRCSRIITVLQCAHCGEMKNHTIDAGH